MKGGGGGIQTLAERAAKLVKVTYAPVEGKKPILSLKEAIQANSFYNTVGELEKRASFAIPRLTFTLHSPPHLMLFA